MPLPSGCQEVWGQRRGLQRAGQIARLGFPVHDVIQRYGIFAMAWPISCAVAARSVSVRTLPSDATE